MKKIKSILAMLIVFPILPFDSKTIEIYPEVREVIESSSIDVEKLETNTGGMVEAYVSTVPYNTEIKKEKTIQEQIISVAKREKFDSEILLKIAFCESSFNRKARNPNSSAKGLYQILNMHGLSEEERFDVDISTTWTIQKIRKNGLSAWKSSQSCWSK